MEQLLADRARAGAARRDDAIVIDADASTGIAKFDFDNLTEKQKNDLLFQGPGFPYQVRPAERL